jgi:restriction endonuclease Mrr
LQFEVEQKLLLYLHGFQRWLEPLSIYAPLADILKLTAAQRHARRSNRKEAAWENRVQCARESLVRKGLLDGSRHGQWRLTAEGHAQAEKIRSFDPAAHGL